MAFPGQFFFGVHIFLSITAKRSMVISSYFKNCFLLRSSPISAPDLFRPIPTGRICRNWSESVGIGRNPWSEMSGALMGGGRITPILSVWCGCIFNDSIWPDVVRTDLLPNIIRKIEIKKFIMADFLKPICCVMLAISQYNIWPYTIIKNTPTPYT